MASTHVRLRALALVLVSTAALGPAPVAVVVAQTAQSVPCREGRGRAHRMVCADPQLAQLDHALAALVARVRAETVGVDGASGKRADPMGAEQARWERRVRNACRTAACLDRAYRARMEDVRTRWAEAL